MKQSEIYRLISRASRKQYLQCSRVKLNALHEIKLVFALKGKLF